MNIHRVLKQSASDIYIVYYIFIYIYIYIYIYKYIIYTGIYIYIYIHIKCLLLGHAGGVVSGAITGKSGGALLGDGAGGGGGEDDDPERINAHLKMASKRGAVDLTAVDDAEEYEKNHGKRRHTVPATYGASRLDSNIFKLEDRPYMMHN